MLVERLFVLEKWKFILGSIFLCIGFFYSGHHVQAAINTWDNSSADGLWSTAENWSLGTVPGVADVATFDGTSDTNININSDINVLGIDINIGYNSTITVNSATAVIGGSDVNQAAGVLDFSDATVDINGGLVLSAGTMTLTSGTTNLEEVLTVTGGTFNHGSGTLIADNPLNRTYNMRPGTPGSANVDSLYNFQQQTANGSVITLNNEALNIVGTATLSDGGLTTGAIHFFGNLIIQSTYDGGSCYFSFTGSTPQTLTNNFAGTLAHRFYIESSSTVTLVGNLTMSDQIISTTGTFNFGSGTIALANTITVQGGTLNFNTATVTITGAFNMTSGSIVLTSGTTTTNNNVTFSGGTLDANGGTMIANHTLAKTWNLQEGVDHLYNLQVNGSNILYFNSEAVLVDGSATFTSGSVSNCTSMTILGNILLQTTFTNVICPFILSGSNNQSITVETADAFNQDITINKSGGSASLASALTLDAASQDLVITSGTFDVNGQILTVNGSGGTFIVDNTGTLALQGVETPSTPTINAGSTIKYNGTGGPYTISNWSYKSLTIAGGASSVFSLPGTKNVGETLTITSGILDMADFNMDISGNTIINGGTLLTGTGNVTFGDAAGDSVTISSGHLKIEADNIAADFTKTAGTWTNSGGTITYMAATGITGALLSAISPYYNLTINSTGSTYALNGAIVVNNDLTLTAGTLGVSASNYGISVGGNWIDTGAGVFTEGSGTVTFTGATGSINANESFYTVTINASGTYTLDNTLTVTRSLNLTAGTLDVSASNYAITVARNWAKTSGNFTPRSGTVIFNDAAQASTISGSTTFYNVTVTTASKTLTFTAGTTQTVSGLLTVTGGGVGTEIILQSTLADNPWYINATTSSVDYVSVRDSVAGTMITHAVDVSRSIDQGNNVNWGFNVAPTVATVTAVQGTDGTGTVTITFIMDDGDNDDTLQAKIEYSVNGGSSWADPTISTTGSDTSATYGDPSVDNAQTYQVGQSGAYITSSSGANTVSIVWNAGTDVSASTDISNAKIRVTPYDGTEAGSADVSSNFILDVVDPSGMSGLSHGNVSTVYATLTWTAGTDTNFNHYELWYSSSSSDASGRTGTAVEWDDGDDATLATASTATTTISTNIKRMYVSIFAIDDFGNTLAGTQLYVPNTGTSSTSSSSSAGATTSYSIALTSPGSGDVFADTDIVTITWAATGAALSYVDIYYSTNGSTFTKIVSNTPALSNYAWRPSGIAGNDVTIRIDGTDLLTVLATDESDAFTITSTSVTNNNTSSDSSSGSSAPIPGSNLKAGGLSTVYLLSDDAKRYPYINAMTYFTWNESFGDLSEVDVSVLANYTIADVMLPRAGVVLVKIQSDPKVYALEENASDPFSPILRWIETEDVATSLYGSNWADYVIDIEPTFFPHFSKGNSVSSSSEITVDRSMMKTRESLAALAG